LFVSFLGFFESSITPALSLFTAQYYKTREQGSRTGERGVHTGSIESTS
jgi:hypothetical protein